MNSIRVMIVGTGQWGHLWIENIQSDPYFEIAALVDPDQERIRLACTKFKIDEKRGYLNLEKCIEETSPDAALIIVPPKHHFSVAMTCIDNKLPILSEKPLANSMEEAVRLKQASENQETLFMVSQDYRWQPPIQALRDALTKGVIGKPGYGTYRHYQSLNIGGWREQMGHVILEDMAIHHFDILRYVTGMECHEIYAESVNPSWSWYVGGATASALMMFQDDFHVNYFGTWVTTGESNSWPGEVRIEGEYGALSLTAKGKVLLSREGVEKVVKQPKMTRTGREFALYQFRNGIKKSITPETDIGDNIKSFAMVRAALKSVKENKPVKLNNLISGYQ